MAERNGLLHSNAFDLTDEREAFLTRLAAETDSLRNVKRMPATRITAADIAPAIETPVRPPAEPNRRKSGRQPVALAEPHVEAAGISIVIESITPEIAKAYLARNVGNRNMRPHKIAQFVADMKAGRWLLNNQGIGFFDDGDLMDGQHRLTAVVQSGVTVRMAVMRGFQRNVVYTIDSGSKRSDVDGERMNGVVVSKVEFACAKTMLLFHEVKDVPDSVRIAFRRRYATEIRFADSVLTSGRCRNSVVMAVIARAVFNRVDVGALKRFGEVLSGDTPRGEKEDGAFRVREFIIGTPNCLGPVPERRKTYRKVEAGLNAFLQGRRLKNLQEVHGEAFPIPEDRDGVLATDRDESNGEA